jgi:hypothetical protein
VDAFQCHALGAVVQYVAGPASIPDGFPEIFNSLHEVLAEGGGRFYFNGYQLSF